jgi:UDP-N-acetylmuramoyl-tripeptide--D-alanyl-D-alanine ligase
VRFPTAELAVQLGGELVGPDVIVDGASIDSRTTEPGQLFVPIVAERDGHDFIPAALDAGAPAYLTSREPVGATAVVVEDTATALLNLGVVARSRISGGVVGITGSVGKTTTKDLVRQCLARSFRTVASARSFNNELGLPLTLLNAPDDAQWVVLEMGARGLGHIGRLAQVARPDVGIVTSVAMAHVEFFGDLDGVARAKGELVAALPESGVAVLNFDDPRVTRMSEFSPCPVLGYAVVADAEVRAEEVRLDDELQPSFRLVTPWGKGEVQLSVHGVQQVPNALAAAAAALWCGVPFESVAASLEAVPASPLRMELRRPADGPALLVDCYNANPASTEAALRSLAALPGARRVAILGLMAELGADTEEQHRAAAALAADLGIEVHGYQTDLYGAAVVPDTAGAVALLRSLSHEDAVLLKGSRVAALEDVVTAYGEAVGSQSLVADA